jgi:hypothetical protein
MDVSKGSACWECEAITDQAVPVSLTLATGHTLRVQLCPACYRRCYLPLIAQMPAPPRRAGR